MLEHLGEQEAADAIVKAIETVLSDKNSPLTPDMGQRGDPGSGQSHCRRGLIGSGLRVLCTRYFEGSRLGIPTRPVPLR